MHSPRITRTTTTIGTTKSTVPLLLLLLLAATFGPLSCCDCAGILTRQPRSIEDNDTAAPPEDPGRSEPISMEFYKSLDNVTDLSDFIERIVEDKDSLDPKLGLQDHSKQIVERAAAVVPKAAICMPERTVVPLIPLNPSKDPNIIYFPKCTHVNRCSGCCNSELMACQPTETELLNFKLIKFRQDNLKSIRNFEAVVVEQHKSCRCDCRIKEADCKPYQIYSPERCLCYCTNEDARQKCLTQNHKIWSEQSCRCVCRETQSCTTGLDFDENTCQCLDPGTRAASSDRRRLIVKAVPVDPDNSTLYETSVADYP